MNIYFLSHYLISNFESDSFSNAIIHFKNGKSGHVNQFVIASLNYVSNNLSNYDFIIRSLNSDELKADRDTPLDYLCYELKYSLRAIYLRNFLVKQNKIRQLKNIHSKLDRFKHLENVYSINNPDNIDLTGKKVLIVDDITTSGATLSTIENLIQANFSEVDIDAFVLAKAADKNMTKLYDEVRIEIDDNYYDTKYPTLWTKNGYRKIGFLKSMHDIFPQRWEYDIVKNSQGDYYVKIFLEISKEIIIIDLGRIKAIFQNTEFWVEDGSNVYFNCDDFFFGVDSGKPYIVNKDYKNIDWEKITNEK